MKHNTETKALVAELRAILRDPNHALSNFVANWPTFAKVAGWLHGLGVGDFTHTSLADEKAAMQWRRGLEEALLTPSKVAKTLREWVDVYARRYPHMDTGDRADCCTLGENETNDCTVHALAAATGERYELAHDFFRTLGRQPGRGINSWCALGKRAVWSTCGWVLEGGRIGPEPITLDRFLRTVAGKDRWLVRISRHLLAVRDGVVLDRRMTGRRSRVTHVWLVKRVSQRLLPAPAEA